MSAVHAIVLSSTNPQPPKEQPSGILGESQRAGCASSGRRKALAGRYTVTRGRQINVSVAGGCLRKADKLPARIDTLCELQIQPCRVVENPGVEVYWRAVFP